MKSTTSNTTFRPRRATGRTVRTAGRGAAGSRPRRRRTPRPRARSASGPRRRESRWARPPWNAAPPRRPPATPWKIEIGREWRTIPRATTASIRLERRRRQAADQQRPCDRPLPRRAEACSQSAASRTEAVWRLDTPSRLPSRATRSSERTTRSSCSVLPPVLAAADLGHQTRLVDREHQFELAPLERRSQLDRVRAHELGFTADHRLGRVGPVVDVEGERHDSISRVRNEPRPQRVGGRSGRPAVRGESSTTTGAAAALTGARARTRNVATMRTAAARHST